jgi:hypothetical protein
MLSSEDGLRRATELAQTENWLAVLVTPARFATNPT